MQNTIQSILFKYWGYQAFRPLQEDIIMSVLEGKDTLALLPTGGGKSICFQVPAMAKDGLCLVITPLIALMKDQVQILKKKGIPAYAIFSGMHYREIDITLDNCIYGNAKFLYISPERLQTELFQVRLKKMNVNLIAIDEAHCISQWGYDFRPPYLKIAEIRERLPNVPILALTATATPNVVNDIQEKLIFKEHNVFQKSFTRENLIYALIYEEDKLNRLLRIIDKVKGCGIIYVRNRKKTQEIAQFLQRKGIKADFYHAGLDMTTRDKKQASWMHNQTRVIVCTNAFGMGIDKPDVRFVIHMDLPDSLEAYFQEAGRAGRDEKKAYALLLYNESDRLDLEQHFENSYPPIEDIRNIYNAIGNYLQIPVNSGMDHCYDFDLHTFCVNYNLKPVIVFNSIKFLERAGYITHIDDFFTASQVYFIASKEDLYRFQVSNKTYDILIKTLLRSYAGLYTEFTNIYEDELTKRLNIPKEQLTKMLFQLDQLNLIIYKPHTGLPKLLFNQPRLDKSQLRITPDNYEFLKTNARKRLNAAINYATSTNHCRNQMLLEYFGEENSNRCGTCDYCLGRNKVNLSKLEFDEILTYIKPLLQNNEFSIEELVDKIRNINEDKVINAVNWLLDNDKIKYTDNNKLKWSQNS